MNYDINVIIPHVSHVFFMFLRNSENPYSPGITFDVTEESMKTCINACFNTSCQKLSETPRFPNLNI